MNFTQATLRDEVRLLAEEAYHRNLISGYGDVLEDNEFQIVFQGKPRHFSLESAYSFLADLIVGKHYNSQLAPKA